MLSSVVEHRIADPAVTGSNPVVSWSFLVGVVGNISACHADARGSIPRLGVFLFFKILKLKKSLCRVVSVGVFFQKSLVEVYKKFYSKKCAIRESNSGHLVGNEVS